MTILLCDYCNRIIIAKNHKVIIIKMMVNALPEAFPATEMVSVSSGPNIAAISKTTAGSINWVTAGVGLAAFIGFAYLFAKASGKLREGLHNLTGGLVSKPT